MYWGSLLMSEGATLGCAMELAATPAGLTRGVYWTLHSASAYVAAKLGTNLRYILQQHSQWHMAHVGSASFCMFRTQSVHVHLHRLCRPFVSVKVGGWVGECVTGGVGGEGAMT